LALLALQSQPDLIDQVHDRLLAAVVDGTLAPGQRLTQDELAEMLGVSRQPVSHALQLLRRRGLFVDAGKRGIAVAPIDAQRISDLYQVREALDGVAAEQAATRQRERKLNVRQIESLRSVLARGAELTGATPMPLMIDADVAFHTAIHVLSGNSAIGETVAEQWPHFRRSMKVVLEGPEMRARVWREHAQIVDAILSGDDKAAGLAARSHTARAGADTARRLNERQPPV
jgi:DNA-binding GntR family transcriptional regulator